MIRPPSIVPYYILPVLLCLLSFIGGHPLAADDAGEAEETAQKLDSSLKTFAGEFISITPGKGQFPESFQMGNSDDPTSQKTVQMPRPFRISKYEVWQQLYADVMGTNPSRWKGMRNSAEQMTWHQANDFCRRITQLMRERKLIAPDEVIRLPTEAEWEYCCRAGTTTRYSFGKSAQQPGDIAPHARVLDQFAWHTGNATGHDPAVGVLKPNPWGLYDMHGYLWEFTSDDWNSHGSSPDKTGRQCVIRGGSWRDPFPQLRSDSRTGFDKTATSDAVGFRCIIARDDLPVGQD